MNRARRGSMAGRPFVVVVVLLLVVAIGVLWIRRDPRRLMLVPNGVMLVSADSRTHFFRDSSFVLERHPDGGDSYPIRIAVWFDERAPLNSEAAIMRGIESFAAREAGARLTRVAGGVFHPVLAMQETMAWADITVDLWALGGYRSDITLYCPLPRGGGDPTREPVHLASNRGRVAPGNGLDVLGELVDIASRARCADVGASRVAATAPRSVDSAVTTAQLSATPPEPQRLLPASRMTTLAVSPPKGLNEQDTVRRHVRRDADTARGDSMAVDRAGARSQAVVRLAMVVDTIRLRVGEAVNPEQALHLTAIRVDGSVVERFVPLYSVDDMSVAAMGASGLRGVAAGVTRAIVRPLSRSAVQGAASALSASFVIVVVP